MNGFFRALFGKPAGNRANGTIVAPPTLPSPPATRSNFTPAKPSPAAPVSESNEGAVRLPVQAILPVLPVEFKARVQQVPRPDVMLSVPLDHVLAHLSLGAIKVSFGQLRAAAPGIFSGEGDRDHIQIALPLNEILARINPRMLARRANQKRVEIPDDITSPFDNRGRGLALGSAKSPTPLPSRPATPAEILTAKLHGSPSESPATEFQSVNSPAKPSAFAAGTPALEPAGAPIAFRGFAPSPAPSPKVTSPVAPPTRPAVPASRGAGDSPLPAASRELINFAHPVPPPTEAAGETFLAVQLAMLAESWPEMLRQEIAQLNLNSAQVALPAGVVEPALRRGKIAFTWKMLRSWIRPAPLPAVSAHDNLMLDLPLKIVAPLFLQQRGAVKKRRQVLVDESIPNLFFGFPQPASPPAEIPGSSPAPHAVPAPAQRASVPAAPAAPAPQTADSNFYVWDDVADTARVEETETRPPVAQTDFLSRYATPNDVVARAAALDGVAGALVALPDGLMVASKLPPDQNGDTLAAFVPQIYGKVSQCTKELRMGALNNLSFTVGNIPWKVFRVNAIFFAAFGRAGQPMPTLHLAALAAQLDRKKQ